MNTDSINEAGSGPPRGYTVVLPPGWAKIPLRAGSENAIAGALDRVFAGHSRDAVAVARRELQTRLRELTAAARDSGGLDLYLPIGPPHGLPLGASFVVAEVSFGAAEPLDPSLLIARLSAEVDAQTLVIDGVPGSRAETTASVDARRDAPCGSRRVEYTFPVPHDPDRWVLVSFSTVGQGDPRDELADLGVELFDAIMTTFRWTRASAQAGSGKS